MPPSRVGTAQATIYTPTGGIAVPDRYGPRSRNPQEKVRVVCEYMGGNFGNKNQNQDADLIAAVLAKEAGAAVKLELSRKEDYIGVHGRWPTAQYYKIGVKNDGTLTALQLRGYSGMGPYRKNTGATDGPELYSCPNVESVVTPVWTNKTVSANMRGPEFPQGFFGIQSMMDDVAAKLKIDPVDFIVKNMTRKFRDETEYTIYSLEDCIRRGVERFDWKQRWRPAGSSAGPIKRGVGVSFMAFRSGLGRSNAVIRVNSKGEYTVHVGVTDVGAGAKTTMGLIAAEALGVPLSKVSVVWGDTDRCPYSVGESGSRTTIMTGQAVVEAARDLKKQIAEKGLPRGTARNDVLIASAAPNRRWQRERSARISARSSATPNWDASGDELPRGSRLRPDHQPADGGKDHRRCGRRIGMALREELPTTGAVARRQRRRLRRAVTHRDAPESNLFIESDDGWGRSGRRAWASRAWCPPRPRLATPCSMHWDDGSRICR